MFIVWSRTLRIIFPSADNVLVLLLVVLFVVVFSVLRQKFRGHARSSDVRPDSPE